MSTSHHPVTSIMGWRAAAAGFDIDAFNADVRQRAAATLIVEMLDMATQPIIAHPELIPAAAHTLHCYAELLLRSRQVIENCPEFQEMVRHHAEHDAQHDGPCGTCDE